jgi:lipoate-protein ligase A
MEVYYSPSNDPIINFALEQYFLKDTDLDVLFIFINNPCIVCGRLQVPYAEVNFMKLLMKNIPIFRRHSGGGTVYHDLGNINFAFISEQDVRRDNYNYYNSILIDVLRHLGIDGLNQFANNIYLRGNKVSGSAQYSFKGRLLHHGTLLVDSDISLIEEVLRLSEKYSTRAVKSNKANIINLRSQLNEKLSINDICFLFTDTFLTKNGGLIASYDNIIGSGVLEKYTYINSLDWNYGISPEYKFQNNFSFEGIEYKLSFIVKKGRVNSFSFSGDGFLTDLNLMDIQHTYNVLWQTISQTFSTKLCYCEKEYLINQFF